MAITKTHIADFIELTTTAIVIDVRSPAEFAHAHFPNAYNIPLFSNEERAVVGTAYKQQSREAAIKKGLDFFGPKMNQIIDAVIALKTLYPNKKNVLVYCWRGGMRSAGVAWLLDLYGLKVSTLIGGYKAFRNWTLAQFNQSYRFNIIGGYTGSGKTLLLQRLQNAHFSVINLEALAHHKGSALGALGEASQPSQEMFENKLATSLYENNKTQPIIFLEDESQRIGKVQIPLGIWTQMRSQTVFFFDIDFEVRLQYLTECYGVHPKDQLIAAILRIQKRLGGLETKNAINFIVENNCKESFRILLQYYDKWYFKGLHKRPNVNDVLITIPSNTVDSNENYILLNNLLHEQY